MNKDLYVCVLMIYVFYVEKEKDANEKITPGREAYKHCRRHFIQLVMSNLNGHTLMAAQVFLMDHEIPVVSSKYFISFFVVAFLAAMRPERISLKCII